MKKKLIYLFILTIISILSIPVVSCFAENGTCGDNLTWDLDESGALTISGKGEMYDYEQGQAPWYSYSLNSNPIQSITIEKGVTSIGNYAFYRAGMSGVSQTAAAEIVLTLPEGLTKISRRPFYNSSITEINLPSTLSSLSSDAFFSCPKLTNITISSSHKFFTTNNGVLFANNGKTLIKYPEQKSGTSYTIPSSVEQIGYGAFYNATMLEKVVFNNSLKSISDLAFYNCTMLESIDLPSSLESIGIAAFTYAGVSSNNYYSIDSVTIPKNVSSIGERAFQDMKEYIVDTNNKHFKSVDGALFTKDGTELLCYPARTDTQSYTIPDTVTNIHSYAFYNSQLNSLTIPDTVTEMSDYALTGNKISNITISAHISEIKTTMFQSCENLQSLTLPEGVTKIDDYAFLYCRNLKVIYMPNSITSIGKGAFYLCTSLEEVIIPENVTELPDNLFYNDTRLRYVYLPENLNSIGAKAFNACTSLKEIDIPEAVKRIEESAFENCTVLSDVTFHGGVEYIGKSAFRKCVIRKITLPDSLACIDEYAFNSTPLMEVVLPAGVECVGSYAFQNCTKLTDVTLSRKMTEIKSGTFSGCTNLANIKMYDAMQSVGKNAFSDCTELTVDYEGTEEQFEAVNVNSVGNEAFIIAAVTYTQPSRDTVEVIGHYSSTLTMEKEIIADGELVITVTSNDDNPLPPLTLYAGEYDDDGILENVRTDSYKYLTGDMEYKVLTISLPDVSNYKIMIWDDNNTPLTDVITEME